MAFLVQKQKQFPPYDGKGTKTKAQEHKTVDTLLRSEGQQFSMVNEGIRAGTFGQKLMLSCIFFRQI